MSSWNQLQGKFNHDEWNQISLYKKKFNLNNNQLCHKAVENLLSLYPHTIDIMKKEEWNDSLLLLDKFHKFHKPLYILVKNSSYEKFYNEIFYNLLAIFFDHFKERHRIKNRLVEQRSSAFRNHNKVGRPKQKKDPRGRKTIWSE